MESERQYTKIDREEIKNTLPEYESKTNNIEIHLKKFSWLATNQLGLSLVPIKGPPSD